MSDDIESTATPVENADPAKLAQVFAQIDGDQQPGPEAGAAQPQQEQPSMSQAEEIAVAMFTAGQILAVKFPSIAEVFTMEKCSAVAEAVTPLLEHYGLRFSLTGVFALWANAAMAVIGVGLEVRAAVAKDMAAAAAKAAAAGMHDGA